MNKTKVIILGVGRVGFNAIASAQSSLKNNVDIILTDTLRQIEELEKEVEPKPIEFINFKEEQFLDKTNHRQRSKFLGKPKHNYRQK